MYMVYAQTDGGDRFAYCDGAAEALAAARRFEGEGALFVEISDQSGAARSPEEFERAIR
jgi:hypothetical protein